MVGAYLKQPERVDVSPTAPGLLPPAPPRSVVHTGPGAPGAPGRSRAPEGSGGGADTRSAEAVGAPGPGVGRGTRDPLHLSGPHGCTRTHARSTNTQEGVAPAPADAKQQHSRAPHQVHSVPAIGLRQGLLHKVLPAPSAVRGEPCKGAVLGSQGTAAGCTGWLLEGRPGVPTSAPGAAAWPRPPPSLALSVHPMHLCSGKFTAE